VQAVGGQVVSLKRIAMGGLSLDEALALGAWRELTPEELRSLQQAAGTPSD
jgi:16S rRNA pseudouridine516 synthase